MERLSTARIGSWNEFMKVHDVSLLFPIEMEGLNYTAVYLISD